MSKRHLKIYHVVAWLSGRSLGYYRSRKCAKKRGERFGSDYRIDTIRVKA